jgi:hypothetical protein
MKEEADVWARLIRSKLYPPNTTLQGSKNLNKNMAQQGWMSGTNFVIELFSNLKWNLN